MGVGGGGGGGGHQLILAMLPYTINQIYNATSPVQTAGQAKPIVPSLLTPYHALVPPHNKVEALDDPYLNNSC